MTNNPKTIQETLMQVRHNTQKINELMGDDSNAAYWNQEAARARRMGKPLPNDFSRPAAPVARPASTASSAAAPKPTSSVPLPPKKPASLGGSAAAPAKPAQGNVGSQLAGYGFGSRADRLNQDKVNAALGPNNKLKAGSAEANMALLSKFKKEGPAQPAGSDASKDQADALDKAMKAAPAKPTTDGTIAGSGYGTNPRKPEAASSTPAPAAPVAASSTPAGDRRAEPSTSGGAPARAPAAPAPAPANTSATATAPAPAPAPGANAKEQSTATKVGDWIGGTINTGFTNARDNLNAIGDTINDFTKGFHKGYSEKESGPDKKEKKKMSESTLINAFLKLQEVRNRSLNEDIPLPPRRPQTGPAALASQPQDNNPRGEEVKRIENRGGVGYNVYPKGTQTDNEFQQLYGAARKARAGTFNWQGREYTTGQRGGAYVKPADQAAAENKPGYGAQNILRTTADRDTKAQMSQTPSGRPDYTASPPLNRMQRAGANNEKPDDIEAADTSARTQAAAKFSAAHLRQAMGGPMPAAGQPMTGMQQVLARRQAAGTAPAAAPDPKSAPATAPKPIPPIPASSPTSRGTPTPTTPRKSEPAVITPQTIAKNIKGPESSQPRIDAPGSKPKPDATLKTDSSNSPIPYETNNSSGEQKESGGKRKKVSESTLINAFLRLQETKAGNIFEAAKKAKKDYDKDGKIESEKDEVWGSRMRAAKAAGKMEESSCGCNGNCQCNVKEEVNDSLASRIKRYEQNKMEIADERPGVTMRNAASIIKGPESSRERSQPRIDAPGSKPKPDATLKTDSSNSPIPYETNFSPDESQKNKNSKSEKMSTNEEVEQIDELSSKTLRNYMSSIDPSPTTKESEKRLNMYALARLKLNPSEKGVVHATEEVEQIDELSNDTLASYKEKASKQADKAAGVLFNPNNKYTGKEKYQKNDILYHKRLSGMEAADRRMKEEVEIEEASQIGIVSNLFKRYPEIPKEDKGKKEKEFSYQTFTDNGDHVADGFVNARSEKHAQTIVSRKHGTSPHKTFVNAMDEEVDFSEVELAHFASVFEAMPVDQGKTTTQTRTQQTRGDRVGDTVPARDLTDEYMYETKALTPEQKAARAEAGIKRGRPAGSKSGSIHGEEGAPEPKNLVAQNPRTYNKGGKNVVDLEHPSQKGVMRTVPAKEYDSFRIGYLNTEKPADKQRMHDSMVDRVFGKS